MHHCKLLRTAGSTLLCATHVRAPPPEDVCPIAFSTLARFPRLPPQRSPARQVRRAALRAGALCLALYAGDGLWYQAAIEDMLPDGSAHVEYVGWEESAMVGPTELVPLPPPVHYRDAPTHIDDDDEDDGNDDDLAFASQPRPERPALTFGAWEKHERGIGSKLLLKMGYTPGKGLGRGGHGRVEPVPAASPVPPATGLDFVREAATKLGSKRGRDAAASKADIASADHLETRHNLFDVINAKLSHVAPDEAACDRQGTAKPKREHESAQRLRLLKLHGQREQLERAIAKLQSSLSRNAGNKTVKARLDLARGQLAALQRSATATLSVLNAKKQKRDILRF